MSKLRVESFTISIDGFGAGPHQDINNPLGVGGTSLHGWALSTQTFQKKLFCSDGGATGVDDDFAARGFQNIGAWILGRNERGPIFRTGKLMLLYQLTRSFHEAHSPSYFSRRI